MPYHPALLQLRRVQDINDLQRTFYTPDVNAHTIRRNVFRDRNDPTKFYGLADVVFCYANADALKALSSRVPLVAGDNINLLQIMRFELAKALVLNLPTVLRTLALNEPDTRLAHTQRVHVSDILAQAGSVLN